MLAQNIYLMIAIVLCAVLALSYAR